MIYKVKMPKAYARVEWCKQMFGPPIKGGYWWCHRRNLYFREKYHYDWYMLRWA
jgi:hypothetical protein